MKEIIQKSKNPYNPITPRKIHLTILVGLILVALTGLGFIFYKIKIAPMIPKSAVITKQVSGAVTGYKNIKWAKLVKLSSLKEGQKYLKMPKGASNTSFNKIDRGQAVALLGNPRGETFLALEEKQVLAGLLSNNLAQDTKRESSGLVPRALFDVETKIVEMAGNNEQGSQNIDITSFAYQESSNHGKGQDNKGNESSEKDKDKETPADDNAQSGQEQANQGNQGQGQGSQNENQGGQPAEDKKEKDDKEEQTGGGGGGQPAEDKKEKDDKEKQTAEDKKEKDDKEKQTAEDKKEKDDKEKQTGGGGGGVGRRPTLPEAPFGVEEVVCEEFLLVEYETPAPIVKERNTKEGKTVTVSAKNSTSDSISNALVFVPANNYKIKSLNETVVKDKDGKKVNVNGQDLDEDGYIDYIEWEEKELEDEEEFF